MDLISVIIPVYNVEKYLHRCVESVCQQTYPNLEIVLVDDGSPDRCGLICDQLKESDHRIKVVHKENGGLGFARNSGLDQVTGRYVTFVDSDDWIAKDHIENLYNAIVQANAEVCLGGHTKINATGVTSIREGKIEKKIYSGNEIVQQILLPVIGPDEKYPKDVQVQASCCMCLYDVNLIREYEIRFISERYAVSEDLYFNIDFLCHAHKAVAIRETGYFYFENEESISNKFNPQRFERTVNSYKETLDRVKKYGLENVIGFRLDRNYLTKIRIAIRHIVNSDLSYKEKKKEIEVVAQHSLTREVLERYPINTYPKSIRLFVTFIKNQNIVGAYWLMWFRENAENSRQIRKMLRRIGIGR